MTNYDIIYNFFVALLKNDTVNINKNHKLIIENKIDQELKTELQQFLSKVVFESIRTGTIEPIQFIAENYKHLLIFANYDLEYAYCLDRLDIIKYLIKNKFVEVIQGGDEYIQCSFILEGLNERTTSETVLYLISVGFTIEGSYDFFKECLKFKKLDIFKAVYYETNSETGYNFKIELNYAILCKLVIYHNTNVDDLKLIIDMFKICSKVKEYISFNGFDSNVILNTNILDKFEYLFKEYPQIINKMLFHYVDLLNLFNNTNEYLDLINRIHLRNFIFELEKKFKSSIRDRNDEYFVWYKLRKELDIFEEYKTMVKLSVKNFLIIEKDVIDYELMKYI
jgi:hypothetical protein